MKIIIEGHKYFAQQVNEIIKQNQATEKNQG